MKTTLRPISEIPAMPLDTMAINLRECGMQPKQVAHIVRCINSHEALMEAAKGVMEIWDKMVVQETAYPPYIKKFEQLKAALAQADEKGAACPPTAP